MGLAVGSLGFGKQSQAKSGGKEGCNFVLHNEEPQRTRRKKEKKRRGKKREEKRKKERKEEKKEEKKKR